MTNFALPDLGEGLEEAEIVAWHVAEGDHVAAGQPLVSVETDKALVEIPSPQSGRIAGLLAKVGDHVKVGSPIVVFDEGPGVDKGTVVGELAQPPLASPAVRAFAREHGVDLGKVKGSGPGGAVTRADIERACPGEGKAPAGEPLKGMRRAMAINMARSHAEVVPATVWDEADVEEWWSESGDVSVRIVQAIAVACRAVPALNARYDGRHMTRLLQPRVDVGIAIDTEEGLVVPVLRDVDSRDALTLRRDLDILKQGARARTVTPADLRDPSITLSNFGMLAGRQAALVVVPPQVAIVGAGRIARQATPFNHSVTFRHMLPLSLTFDHRAVTGGEASRFLKAMIGDLQGRV